MLILLVGNVTMINENIVPSDWKTVEAIAEEVPNIVALLNKKKSYICTGVAVTEDTVITTAKCLTFNPKYVVIGQAVLNDYPHKNNIMEIASIVKHPDYTFVWEPDDYKMTAVHSNIGVVYTWKKNLHLFFEMAQIGIFFANELHERQFVTVGFGSYNVNNTLALNRRLYYEEECLNPKWYYCVCGFTTDYIRPEEVFGEGGPVLLHNDVVALSSLPCGKPLKPPGVVTYNIFTIIGPYLPWINRLRENQQMVNNSSDRRVVKPFRMIIYVLLLITSISFL